jgi:hypothetical protein
VSATLVRPTAPPPAGPTNDPPAVALDDAWPHTRRTGPWMVAAFMFMVYMIPFDSTFLPFKLPFDAGLDRVVLIAFSLVWLGASVAGRNPPRFKHTSINVAMYIFAILSALSIVLNLRDLAWDQELGLGFKQMLLAFTYLLFFYVVASSLTREDVVPFVKYITVLAAISAIGTIYEYRTGVDLFAHLAKLIPGAIVKAHLSHAAGHQAGRHSAEGPTKHGLCDASLLASAIPFAMILLIRSTTTRAKVVWIVCMLLLVAGCITTLEKTAFILLVVVVLAVIAFHPRRYLRWWPLLIFAVLVTKVASPHSISALRYQFTILDTSSSTSGRTTDYPAVAPFLNTHLLFGRGFGSYNPLKYRILDDQMLGYLIEIGAFGIIAYTALIFSPIIAGFRAARRGLTMHDDVLAAVAGGCVGFFVSNFLYDSFDFRQGPYVFFFLAALAAVVVGRVEPLGGRDQRRNERAGGGLLGSDAAESTA